MNQQDAIRRNEEYQDRTVCHFQAWIHSEPRNASAGDVAGLLEQIGWQKSAGMVRRQAEQAAERNRVVSKLTHTIAQLRARINELDPPPQEHGMRYTGD